MTREEAAEQLHFQEIWLNEHGFLSDWAGEALKMGIAALSGWVRTADRLPTEADSWHGFVVVGSGKQDVFGEEIDFNDWDMVEGDEHWPYWMPLPPLPETAGLEGTKTNR